MNILFYIMGMFYVMSSLFRFSRSSSRYLVEKRILDLPKKKIEKLDEWIYSTIHSSLILFLASYSLQENVLQIMDQKSLLTESESMKMTVAMAFSYFSLDLWRCLYDLNWVFVLHHLCSIQLLFQALWRIREEGHFIMAYLLLLEFNTPFMNLGLLLKSVGFDYTVYGTVWSLHLLSYFLCRIVMIPYITYYYYQNSGISYFQIPNLMIIYFGSLYWAYRQMIGIQKNLLKNEK